LAQRALQPGVGGETTVLRVSNAAIDRGQLFGRRSIVAFKARGDI